MLGIQKDSQNKIKFCHHQAYFQASAITETTTKAVALRCPIKKNSILKKFAKIYSKILVLESLFNKAAGLK